MKVTDTDEPESKTIRELMLESKELDQSQIDRRPNQERFQNLFPVFFLYYLFTF